MVLTTDVDEIVAPVPEWGPLDAYVDRLDEEFVNCIGYEILHMRDREPPFHAEQPVLSQRGFWFANDAYDKPALTMEPMAWEPGLHARSDGRFNFDPDLRLIHLHRVDYEICRERHRLRRNRDWNPDDVERGWAEHNRFVEEKEFAQWFYGQTGLDGFGIELKVSRIPPLIPEPFLSDVRSRSRIGDRSVAAGDPVSSGQPLPGGPRARPPGGSRDQRQHLHRAPLAAA